MTDTTDSVIVYNTLIDSGFQSRVRMRYISAALAVVNEAPTEPSHEKRRAFAGALFEGSVDIKMLCMAVLSDSDIRTACLADATKPGGTITDTSIDDRISSVFTGIAISKSW